VIFVHVKVDANSARIVGNVTLIS